MSADPERAAQLSSLGDVEGFRSLLQAHPELLNAPMEDGSGLVGLEH
jgi:hypothetical protein